MTKLVQLALSRAELFILDICDPVLMLQGDTNERIVRSEVRSVLALIRKALASAPKRIPCKRAKPRKGPMRDPKYRRWLHGEPCAVRWFLGMASPCSGGSDAAHTKNNGMRSKGPDSSCVPLCRKHHSEYDADRAAFEKTYGVNMREIAAEHHACYIKEKESK